MQSTTTIASTLRERAEHGLTRDLLLIMFDAGVAMGLGVETEQAASPEIELLITRVRTRWFAELDAARAWRRTEAPDLRPDEIPEWLRAERERVAALGDAEPPDGWIRALAQAGRP